MIGLEDFLKLRISLTCVECKSDNTFESINKAINFINENNWKSVTFENFHGRNINIGDGPLTYNAFNGSIGIEARMNLFLCSDCYNRIKLKKILK